MHTIRHCVRATIYAHTITISTWHCYIKEANITSSYCTLKMEPTSDFIEMKSSSTKSSRPESSLANNLAYLSSRSYEDTPIDTTDGTLETEDSPTHRNPGSFQNVIPNPAYNQHRRMFRWPLPSGSDASSYNHLNWGPTETSRSDASSYNHLNWGPTEIGNRLKSMKSIHYKLLSIAILSIMALLISVATVVSLNLELAVVRDELQQIQESNCTTLQSDLNMLKSLISSPVDLYQGCFPERRRCDLGPASNLYWRQCSTEELPMDSPVSEATGTIRYFINSALYIHHILILTYEGTSFAICACHGWNAQIGFIYENV